MTFTGSAKLTTTRGTTPRPMIQKHRDILRHVRADLAKDMDPQEVLLQMSTNLVFSPRDEEEIMAKEGRTRQCETLLDILPRRGAEAFSSFVNALKSSRFQLHLATIIREAGKCF